YELFCAEKFPESQSIEYHWTNSSVPLLVRAMVLADKMLFIAGAPDVVDEEQAFDYWSAEPNDPNVDRDIPAKLYEQDAVLKDQRGALLWAVSTADGKDLARYELESLPVWDGMAAANGRLYLSLSSGKVQCFAGGNYPPAVDAGADQSIYPLAPAVLDATVTDDGLPRVDPSDPCSAPIGVTANWAKLEGPGEITFGDPCAVDTTALFSQWGSYALRLTAFDGATPYYDDLNVTVFRPGDLDLDNDVDIIDLSRLVAQWLYEQCDVSNDWCGGADQTATGAVELGDYAITSSNWLAGAYPAAPAELMAMPGDSVIGLDWDDNAEADLAGYNVYRSFGSGSGYVRVNESLLTDSEYEDSDVSRFITYYYLVTAEDTFGYESAYSDEVSASSGVQPVMKLLASIGVTADRADVVTWRDQAKSNDAVQDTADERPTLVLAAINGEPAIDFDGTGQHLDVADSDDTNTGGPYSGKTLVVVFTTGGDITGRQVIWEQGGGVRGLSFYIDSGNLYINGWNRQETVWEPTGLNAPVSQKSAYVATLVLDADAGTFEGFINGASIGSVDSVAELYSHSNDCAFGHVEGATRFHDGSTKGPANFRGQIAEFYQYDRALSSDDLETLERILMSKYDIGGS
ncbi:MAG: hypothetical protein JSU70_05300, partial [Phycisphaerales bacterium]